MKKQFPTSYSYLVIKPQDALAEELKTFAEHLKPYPFIPVKNLTKDQL